ncbi:alpha-N-acetylglucosaminidase C-terminal domain-containing protein [bacterium]|nr:alpha-N-acetylglucosaminidase C-terminal domain-containing protein [bacterium]
MRRSQSRRSSPTSSFRKSRASATPTKAGAAFPTTFIHPADPRFREISRLFIEEQTRLFGTDHLYAADPFIEMTPASTDPAYLADFARAVYQGMTAADPEAVWVQQGWFFSFDPGFWKPEQGRAFVSAVPDEHLLFLDLYCENVEVWRRTEGFFGKPWLWSIVGCFGDTVTLQGGLPQIADRLPAAVASPEGSRLRGTGLLMEGLGYNPVVYDLMSDLSWQPRRLDLSAWLDDYTLRRYGRKDAHAQAAWRTLLATAYRAPARTGTTLEMRPDFALGWRFRGLPYDPAALAGAWPELLAAAPRLGDRDTYRFDLVNVSRQVLANYAGQVYSRMMAAYERKDRPEFLRLRDEYLQLFADLDELLATRREFLLGPWLADAERWAGSEPERRLYHYNARRLITIWGVEENPWDLNDYARKQWSGLLTDFYRPRWEMFLSALSRALDTGVAFDTSAYRRDIVALEEAWVRQDRSFPTAPRGDSVAVCRRLLRAYGSRVRRPEASSLTTGKPATCSHALPGHPPELANDGWFGDTQRFWSTDVTADPEAWWQVDLEKPTTVGRVVLVFYFGDRRTYGYTVETSRDGQSFELAYDGRDNEERATIAGADCRFAPRKARYLRVTLPRNSANTGRHLVEVMAYPE